MHINFFMEVFSKFTLLLRKRIYPYEYMDLGEVIDEISLPGKNEFCISLNMKDITFWL